MSSHKGADAKLNKKPVSPKTGPYRKGKAAADSEHDAAVEHQAPHMHAHAQEEAAAQPAEEKKPHFHFMGSDLLRARLPKTFEVAETIAGEWSSGGTFENLPIKSKPLQSAARKGLLKAKQVEKKLDDAGVFMLAKAGIDYAKSKIQQRAGR